MTGVQTCALPICSTTPAISVTGFDPAPGQVLDVAARDPMGMETLPQALVLDYDALSTCVVTP